MGKADKTAKYINSPESLIYSKSRELYGLYQAKQAISKANKCYLGGGLYRRYLYASVGCGECRR